LWGLSMFNKNILKVFWDIGGVIPPKN
jgi:hypothetical protein